ncbi:MAG: SDR family oxidoreductase [Planctomycetes bacterium]|nr:SDR family oxidoreductase [Planctomycetota bacterium]
MESQKVALITGCGRRRIGFHVAEALVFRGYSLAIHYNSSKKEAAETLEYFRGQGVRAVALHADLADEVGVLSLVQAVQHQLGRIDLLVNCAAEWKSKALEEIGADDMRRNLEVNTLATFLCSLQAGLVMVKQPEGGNIITIGDWATERPYLNYAAYLVSKGAIPALTRSLAVELGTRNPNVRVNCILPGPVLLPPDLPEAERQQAIHGTLVKREGSPKNIAQAVSFFVENDFVTGVCLPVDGGRSVYAPE